jgi:hypothetical protein
VKALKLTKAQRRILQYFDVMKLVALHVPRARLTISQARALERRGLIVCTRDFARLTDAGRAALRGES